MASVSTSHSAIEMAKKACAAAQKCLHTSINTLQSKYSAAGSGWQDNKYKELGEVIGTATKAMKEPIGDLQKSISDLVVLQAIIAEYEEA